MKTPVKSNFAHTTHIHPDVLELPYPNLGIEAKLFVTHHNWFI